MSHIHSEADIEIFAKAIKLPPNERHTFVERECEDVDRAAQILLLIQAHEAPDSFLDARVAETQSVDRQTDAIESEGSVIGRYKLLQQLGEGGFGVVFMAEQTEPVRRKVALKIIKPGMDSKAVIARFEAERQALAMMDHPHIAKVLDGGTTQQGRPYFVMELVKGVAITEYCDKKKLPPRERLQLFIDVCKAIQHAHQKSVIHRDLKPSNVMVTLHDGVPVVKVIDFGVAKALNQQLTEKTLFTRYGQMIGTPQYMSPEQAEMSGLDVDTRSDVYSLGVMLYELLTGTTPLTSSHLHTAGYAEMQRLICEGECEKPSTRLSSTTEQDLADIATSRDLTPVDLQKEVKGDLDWIVMKSLEKDRERRYESPNALAQDVERFLNQEPIEARAPTFGYRLKKTIAKNKLLFGCVATVVASLAIATFVATRSYLQLRTSVVDLRSSVFSEGIQQLFSGNIKEGEAAIVKLEELGDDQRAVQLQGIKYNNTNQFEKTVKLLEPRFESNPDSVGSTAILTMGYSGSLDVIKWSQILEKVESLKPKTPEEKLLVAYSGPYLDDPLRALELLDHSWSERRIPLTTLVRARVSMEVAAQTGGL